MRKILIYLVILALVYNGANAGLFGDDVDLADLSQLSPDALETLKDAEFNVFFTKVKPVYLPLTAGADRTHSQFLSSMQDHAARLH